MLELGFGVIMLQSIKGFLQPFYFHILMQQIARFDQELNYVPYRYRHRSRTNPKEQGEGREAGRYSKGKGERFNPQKYREERKLAMANVEGRVRRVEDEEQEWIGAESHPLRQEEPAQQRQKQELADEDRQGRQMHNPPVQKQQMSWSPFERQHFNDDLYANHVPRKSFKQQSSTEQYNKEMADLTHKISAEINSVFNESELQEIKDTILKNIQETQKSDKMIENVRENIEKNSQEGFPSIQKQKQFQQMTNSLKVKVNSGFVNQQEKPFQQEPADVFDKYKKKSPPRLDAPSKRSQSNPTNTNHIDNLEKTNFKSQLPRKVEQPSLKLQALEQFMPEGNQRSQFIRSPKKTTTFEKIQQKMTQLLIQNQPIHLQAPTANYPEDNTKEEPSRDKNLKTTNIKEKMKERKVLANQWKKKQMEKIEKKVQIEPPQIHQQVFQQPAACEILNKFSKQTPNEAMRLAKQAKSREKAREAVTHVAANTINTGSYSISKSNALGYSSKTGYASKLKKDKPAQFPQKVEQPKQHFHSPIKMIKSPTEQQQQQQQSASLCSISQYSAVRKAKERSLHPSSPQQIQQQKSQFPRPESASRQLELSYIESSFEHNTQRNPKFSASKHHEYQDQQPSKNHSVSQNQQARSSRVVSDHLFSHPASYVHEHPSPLGNSSIIKSQDGDELLKMMAINTDNREFSSLIIEDKEHQMETEKEPFNHQFQGIIDSNEQEYSSKSFSMSQEEIRRQFQEKIGDFQLRDLLALERAEREENEGADCMELEQINEDSQVVLQARQTADFANLRSRDNATPQGSTLQLKLNQSNSRASQMQPSPLLLRRHLHPKSALQRFNRSKHNSADCTKTPKTARFNFSLSLLKQSRLSNQLEERWRGRLDRNIPRFKTRIHQFY